MQGNKEYEIGIPDNSFFRKANDKFYQNNPDGCGLVNNVDPLS